MGNTQSAVEQLHALKEEYAVKQAEILESALSELKENLKTAKTEVTRIEEEIAAQTGTSVSEKPHGRRLKPLEQGSDEWNKVAGQIQIVLKNYKEGLNGRAIAKKLGLTAPNEIRHIQPVIHATTRREGKGISTKFILQ